MLTKDAFIWSKYSKTVTVKLDYCLTYWNQSARVKNDNVNLN